MVKYLKVCLAVLAGFFMTASAQEKVVNVYSHRHYETDKRLFAQFEKESGIKVNIVKANADELINRLQIEGSNSPADILLTVDAGRLWRAQERGLLQPVESEILRENVPANLRDPAGHWFGLTTRARVIVYAADRVKPEELSTYEALAERRWRKRIAVRSSENIYNQSLLASLIANDGVDAAAKWAEGMVENLARKPKGNDRDQIKALASGQADLAIVNTYYLGLLLHSEDAGEREVASKVAICFPNQGDRGAHINISGAGVTRHAPNKDAAIKLLEFLSGAEAQAAFAGSNYEYPVNPRVPWSEQLQAWGEFKADALNVGELGRHNDEAVRIFDRAGWR